MDILFLGIVVFLFVLAIFDLSVGVSNDAVNFLNSAIGTKAASFKKVILIASIGVFAGAIMSNGMMDIARHGIFRPEHFAFYELMCIFMAVMVTDIILLDVFNSLGMPTSTTVSMVFELLGATFALSIFKLAGDTTGLEFADLLNTEKALSVILGIFLSVAIAFFFGMVVQYLSRVIFTFNYTHRLRWTIGIFGGIATTAIIYFLLIKGAKDFAMMTPDVKAWIAQHTAQIILGCLVGFSILMQILHWLKINVFKVIVLLGTFALAMAFAGNDLVNFIGVPLSGFASYQDYMTNGAGNPNTFMMGSLNGPANTPIIFLLLAGAIMVISLITSKKARKVVNTSVNLARQSGGEEMFGSSRIARRLVRLSLYCSSWIVSVTPNRVSRWLNKRFDTSEAIIEEGAAFDLIRGSVNLVLAGALIALGTSLKLPLSTTYVTFMVAMGTSLADRAWGRESAVFRITGVISVIGGWFITAGVAFIGAAILGSIMYLGGMIVVVIITLIAILVLVHNNLGKRTKDDQKEDDSTFQTILTTEDKERAWELFQNYLAERQSQFMRFAIETYEDITTGFMKDDNRLLSKSEHALIKEKYVLKNTRRKETLCLRTLNRQTSIEHSAWFHLAQNSQMAMTYNLRHINEVCKEHVENNFRTLPKRYIAQFVDIRDEIIEIFKDSDTLFHSPNMERTQELREHCEVLKNQLSKMSHHICEQLREDDAENMSVGYVYLNLLQESQEVLSNLRKLLRASAKLQA